MNLPAGAPGPPGAGNRSLQGGIRQLVLLCRESLLTARSAPTRVLRDRENSSNQRLPPEVSGGGCG